jgi:hypothetical protein
VEELASTSGASPSDEGSRGLTALRQKMAAYQRNGARLGSTVTALGLVRLVCQPKLMGTAVRNAPGASALPQPCANSRVCGWPSRNTTAGRCFTNCCVAVRFQPSPAQLRTDAHLAALAIANGWRLVSFGRDFERFEGLRRLSLP